MNTVILIGRLTKDPELRYISESEMSVATFTLAVDRAKKEKQADFLRITVFGKQAENCERFLSKGKQVAVHGRINTGKYEDKDGKMVYTTDIIADRVEFLGSKSEDKDEGFRQTPDVPEGFQALDDDDIPF